VTAEIADSWTSKDSGASMNSNKIDERGLEKSDGEGGIRFAERL
jgi:hypothetical protein